MSNQTRTSSTLGASGALGGSETLNGPDETLGPAAQKVFIVAAFIACILAVILFWGPSKMLYVNWRLVDSYYSHGFLVPPLSLFMIWLKRKELAGPPAKPNPLGYPFVLGSVFLLLMGDFLGFGVFRQLSLVPMVAGLALLFLGKRRTIALWFPIAFLLLMIPIPASLTQSIALNLKLFAAEMAVLAANVLTFPMVREGSFIHFGNDKLLIGEVCGGLRSLIALFAVGTLMAYYSKTRLWARFAVLALSGPIAIFANVFRIFLLCVVGYFWGSRVASGRFHDVSGILIFAVAFGLFFTLEAILRRVATPDHEKETPSS